MCVVGINVLITRSQYFYYYYYYYYDYYDYYRTDKRMTYSVGPSCALRVAGK